MSEMPSSRKLALKGLILLAITAPGPLLYGAYQWGVKLYPAFALGLFAERKDLATLIAGLSFTMMGFLATIIMVLFAIVNSRTFRRYKNREYLNLFFFLYVASILLLAITAFVSIIGFSKTEFVFLFRAMIILFINNIVQVVLISTIIVNLAWQASEESPPEQEDSD